MKRRNPLSPRLPSAPPWDPKATALGVYVTDDFQRASDYAYLIGEDTSSIPVVIGIDSVGLVRHPDPQAIDLLAEPYDYYRSDLLNYIRSEYTQELYSLKEQGISTEQRRLLLGNYREYAFKKITNPNRYVRPVMATYASHALEKVDAASVIFPKSQTWMPLTIFHQIYGAEAPQKIWQWLNWKEDPEESPYSSQYLYCSQGSSIPDAVINTASQMFYFDQDIGWDRITRVWALGDYDQRNLIINNGRSPEEVFHGTSSSRFNQAFPDIIF